MIMHKCATDSLEQHSSGFEFRHILSCSNFFTTLEYIIKEKLKYGGAKQKKYEGIVGEQKICLDFLLKCLSIFYFYIISM